MLVTAIHTTWLKPSRADSATIPSSELHLLESGSTLSASDIGPLISGHYLLTLFSPKQGYKEWYVFADHISIGVDLPIPFYPQYDNTYEPYTSCFATSVAMSLGYYGVTPSGSLHLEDELYQYLVSNGFDRFSWDSMKSLATAYGCIATPNMSGSFTDIIHALDNGQPVILGTYFTRSGHIVLLKGYDQEGVIAHDPWGYALGSYEYDLTHSGECVRYSWQFLSRNASDVGGLDPHDLWIMPIVKG